MYGLSKGLHNPLVYPAFGLLETQFISHACVRGTCRVRGVRFMALRRPPALPSTQGAWVLFLCPNKV